MFGSGFRNQLTFTDQDAAFGFERLCASTTTDQSTVGRVVNPTTATTTTTTTLTSPDIPKQFSTLAILLPFSSVPTGSKGGGEEEVSEQEDE